LIDTALLEEKKWGYVQILKIACVRWEWRECVL